MSAPRYAVYFSPRSDTALAQFGRTWLGRDAESGAMLGPPTIDGVSLETWRTAVAEPARYGFHATLKPPFRLIPDVEPQILEDAVASLAARSVRPTPLRLVLGMIGSWLALTPHERSRPLEALAACCVTELDHFRAPADLVETARRRMAGLSARQDELLVTWGYPYVLDEFRAHLTIAGPLDGRSRAMLWKALAGPVSAACTDPVEIADLCLFEQVAPGAEFRLRRRYPIGSTPA